VVEDSAAPVTGFWLALTALGGDLSRAVFYLTESVWDSQEIADMIHVWFRDKEAGTDDSTAFQ
jgi:hypothetical protein